MLIAGLVLAPLLFVQALPERALFNALILAPVPSALPAPPPIMVAKRILHAAQTPRKFNAGALVSPVVVPKVVAIINEAPPLQMDTMAGGVPGGIPGVPMAGAGTEILSNALSVVAPPPPKSMAPAAPAPPAAPRQIKVGGDVQAALILQQIQPVYPMLARQGHIRGSVVLSAVIGTDGKIKNLTVVSGHPLLVDAALSAVRRWIYQPTVLDGILVEVNTDIIVRFGLTS
jgi:protein TonB